MAFYETLSESQLEFADLLGLLGTAPDPLTILLEREDEDAQNFVDTLQWIDLQERSRRTQQPR